MTYDVFSGVLIAQSDNDPAVRVFATALSGGSNYYETEGCIAVDDDSLFIEIQKLFEKEDGGTLGVVAGRAGTLV